MEILAPKRIITCNDAFEILEGFGIAFEEEIIDFDKIEKLEKKYKKKAKRVNLTMLPSFINLHTHLEFSTIKSFYKLEFGSFTKWLKSVIKNREELFKSVDIKKAIKEILKSGTSFIGEISSTGISLNYLKNSPLKVIFFNEFIGKNLI